METRIRLEKEWNVVNTNTIIEWISASNLNVLLLDTYLLNLRNILRFNTLWSLLISSITSTVSVTQFTLSDESNPYISWGVKILIFVTSIITSLITGYIKVEKIQETIEQLEEHKKNWLSFMYSLTSEIQVGMPFRNDATVIINAKKDEFNSVSCKQIDIPQYIQKQVSEFLMKKRNADIRIQEAQEQKKRDRQEQRSLFCGGPTLSSLCCCCFYWCGYLVKSRCVEKTEEDYNMESIGTKLSFFHSINKELKNELLELVKAFPNEVIELHFDRKNDMFNYKIINNKYQKIKDPHHTLTVFKLNSSSQCEQSPIQAKSQVPSQIYRSSHNQQYEAKRTIKLQNTLKRIPSESSLPKSPIEEQNTLENEMV